MQEARAASLAPVDGSTDELTLTLRDVEPQTAYFGDVTTRTVGLGPNEVLLAAMFDAKPAPGRDLNVDDKHNAALDWQSIDGRGTLIVHRRNGVDQRG